MSDGDETTAVPTLRQVKDGVSGSVTRPIQGTGPLGRVFGRFELLIEMGQGGMATLYLARIRGPEKFQKLVAIKTIHDHLARNQDFLNMFLDEARIAALIDHPNVVTIFDLGEISGRYFIAMEYVHGQTLTDILKTAVKRPDDFPWHLACRIVSDAASGLHAAHELRSADGTPLGVVHRDVSPQNILISYTGTVKVVDFGVAYASERLSETVTGTLKGKLAYMSPEQAGGSQVDRRSDVFSLGVVLWESLAKRRLFKRANEAATLMAVREGEVPSLRKIGVQIPVALERVVMKALARDRDERYQTAQELADEIDAILSDAQERAGRSELSALMDSFFYDRRKIKEEQIKSAQHSTLNTAAKGVGMVESTSTSLEDADIVRNRRSKRRLWRLWGGLALPLILVLGGLAWWGWHDRSRRNTLPSMTNSPGHRDVASRGTPVVRRRKTVTIEVRVTPPTNKAEIVFHGERFSGSVVRLQTKRSSNAEQVIVTAPGHERVVALVIPDRDQTLTVPLRVLSEPRHGQRDRSARSTRSGARALTRRPRGRRPARKRPRGRPRSRSRSRARARPRKPGLMDW